MKLLAILSCILWGSAFAGAKIGFEYMPPILLSGMRFTLAGVLLFPLIIGKKLDVVSTIKHNWKFMMKFSFVQTFLQYGMFFLALNEVPGAVAAIINGAGPLFIAILAHFAMPDDKITPQKLFSIILGLAGVVFISAANGIAADIGNIAFFLGVIFLIVSMIIAGYTNIMVAKYKEKLSPIVLTSFANFTGGIALFIFGLFVEELPMAKLPIEFYAAWLWLAIIPAAGFTMWYTLLQRPGVKVSDLNMWKFIIPVTGCLLSWLLLPGESPNTASILCIIIIATSLQLYQYPIKLKRNKNKTPIND